MEKGKNHLVLVHNSETWRRDVAQIFISRSCLLYRDRVKWKNLDYRIAKPYGNTEEAKIEDYKFCKETIAKINPLILDLLNKYHDLDYSPRQWKIIIGHWLEIFVSIYINRYRSLEKCLKENNIGSITFYNDKEYSLVTEDIYSALWASSDCVWNSVIFSRIFSEMGLDLSIKKIDSPSSFFSNKVSIADSLKNQILKIIKKLLIRVTKQLSRNTDSFIVNTFLPKSKEIELNLLFYQFPVVWKSSVPSNFPILDRISRENLSQALIRNANNTFEKVLYKNIFDALPKAYLENFSFLKEYPDKLGWPKVPRFIFTSNNFFSDEIFKIWVAEKIMQGVKYIVGQHGNNYGTLSSMDPSVEEDTSDVFLTWGWSRSRKDVPSFILKCPKLFSNPQSRRNQILLIENSPLHAIKTWDVGDEFNTYFNEQKRFVSLLDAEIKRELVVRLHREHSVHIWGEYERWTAFNPNIKINSGLEDIGVLVRSSKLVVHSYDSTGLLETLSQNIPTMGFWVGGTSHLIDSAKNDYKILYEVGILHNSTQSIACKINQIWGNVDSWWSSHEIQNARELFCDKYARISKHPVIELRNIIYKEIKR